MDILMKKIKTLEAANIIGGTCKQNCIYSYETVVVGGAVTCKLVGTCTDKKGRVTISLAETNMSNCGGNPNQAN
jgi:hypothetical protein